MSFFEWGIIAVIATGIIAGIIIETAIIVKHNERIINAMAAIPQDIRTHVSNMANMVNVSIRNLDNKMDRAIANAGVDVDKVVADIKTAADKAVEEAKAAIKKI